MAITEVSVDVVRKLEAIVGKEHIILDQERRLDYGHDETEDYSFLPDVVVKPRTPEEISAILKICNEHLIPITPRGAGTGLAGSALPVHKGIILSMERFNSILV